MTFLDAAYEVLKQAGQPLHHAEIVNRALAATFFHLYGIKREVVDYIVAPSPCSAASVAQLFLATDLRVNAA